MQYVNAVKKKFRIRRKNALVSWIKPSCIKQPNSVNVMWNNLKRRNPNKSSRFTNVPSIKAFLRSFRLAVSTLTVIWRHHCFASGTPMGVCADKFLKSHFKFDFWAKFYTEYLSLALFVNLAQHQRLFFYLKRETHVSALLNEIN